MQISESTSDRIAGFTLLETIVAFVIISVSLAVAIRTISFSIHNAERTRVETRMRGIAKTVLVEKEHLLQSGLEERGTLEQNFTWHLSVNPVAVKTTNDIGMVTLRIHHEKRPNLSETYISFVRDN